MQKILGERLRLICTPDKFVGLCAVFQILGNQRMQKSTLVRVGA